MKRASLCAMQETSTAEDPADGDRIAVLEAALAESRYFHRESLGVSLS